MKSVFYLALSNVWTAGPCKRKSEAVKQHLQLFMYVEQKAREKREPKNLSHSLHHIKLILYRYLRFRFLA